MRRSSTSAASVAAVLAVLLAAPSAPARAASPCDAPARFVRAVDTAGSPAPLLRPYVVGGLAAVALRDEDGVRWLQLAVHSVDDARRQLGSAAGGDAQVAARGDGVWLRCPAAAPRT